MDGRKSHTDIRSVVHVRDTSTKQNRSFPHIDLANRKNPAGPTQTLPAQRPASGLSMRLMTSASHQSGGCFSKRPSSLAFSAVQYPKDIHQLLERDRDGRR